MTSLLWLIPIALILGASALATFVWALKSGQFDDTSGDAERMLEDDDFPLL
ncbi:cbb3-type cytochrome oxidase assembly protein CcoS [uncultured Algimonas sp.]|uniref:cbb3-type cytochrome oxidase assembly protein CcoS n=1 Tax=uncultured Algimonas sp. TaxID=1547920 RepID=UPI00261DF6FB|nr:cbb3-type cytochrome oxidase assembly protein CcoS [uncultured Algimonas sp.]